MDFDGDENQFVNDEYELDDFQRAMVILKENAANGINCNTGENLLKPLVEFFSS